MKHVTDRGGVMINFEVEARTGNLVVRGSRREFLNGEDEKTKIALVYQIAQEMLDDVFEAGGHEAVAKLLCAVADTLCEILLQPDAFEVLPHLTPYDPVELRELEMTFLPGDGHSDEFIGTFAGFTKRSSVFTFHPWRKHGDRPRQYSFYSDGGRIRVAVKEIAP